jgi:hypothetical protein
LFALDAITGVTAVKIARKELGTVLNTYENITLSLSTMFAPLTRLSSSAQGTIAIGPTRPNAVQSPATQRKIKLLKNPYYSFHIF